MHIKVNGSYHNVIINHHSAELRNSVGESRKEIIAINLASNHTSSFDTYENPVTREEITEFLENRM